MELGTRDKLATFIAARFSVRNPVEMAEVMTPFVDELLAEAREDGYREAMGYQRVDDHRGEG